MPPYEIKCPNCNCAIALDEKAVKRIADREGKEVRERGGEKSMQKRDFEGGQDTFELECEVKRVTERAILIETEDGEEVWLPKSQLIDWDEDEDLEDIKSVEMTLWIAKQKGFTS